MQYTLNRCCPGRALAPAKLAIDATSNLAKTSCSGCREEPGHAACKAPATPGAAMSHASASLPVKSTTSAASHAAATHVPSWGPASLQGKSLSSMASKVAAKVVGLFDLLGAVSQLHGALGARALAQQAQQLAGLLVGELACAVQAHVELVHEAGDGGDLAGQSMRAAKTAAGRPGEGLHALQRWCCSVTQRLLSKACA
eukprot:GHRQ01022196.1.p1 GENE.GHRQ01022196.1~~GHRQ01022196.1.p1  ORF type:complete len:199 (+),score=48.00 GHRQ01022196.1:400-996(+)